MKLGILSHGDKYIRSGEIIIFFKNIVLSQNISKHKEKKENYQHECPW